MIVFDPADPFPLLPEGTLRYADAQTHSEQVDRWLGLNTVSVEDSLIQSAKIQSLNGVEKKRLWIGLPVQALLTPYTEIRALLSRLSPKPGETLVDLGAGYGRIGFVIGTHHPGVRFIGYESVEERVNEGLRALARRGFRGIDLKHADLAASDFQPEPAEFYFLYDYSQNSAIEKTLQDLRALAQTRPITVVGRGRSSRDIIERKHPWLSGVVPPEHTSHYSIYRTHS